MTAANTLYLEIGNNINHSIESQMFGKTCFKINKKAFVCFFDDCMVFKLARYNHKQALKLSDSKLFDPSGKGRPMKEWVQVTYKHQALWKEFAEHASKYVVELSHRMQ